MITTPDVMRREVWLADLEPTRGDEIRKTRPVVIVNDDDMGRLRLRIVIPITQWDEQYAAFPWMVRLEPTQENGLKKMSAADTFQIRSISLERLKSKLGKLPTEQVAMIAYAVAMCV